MKRTDFSSRDGGSLFHSSIQEGTALAFSPSSILFIHVHWQCPHETHRCTIFFNNLHEWFKDIKKPLYITFLQVIQYRVCLVMTLLRSLYCKIVISKYPKKYRIRISKLEQRNVATVTEHVRHCLVQSDYNSLCK